MANLGTVVTTRMDEVDSFLRGHKVTEDEDSRKTANMFVTGCAKSVSECISGQTPSKNILPDLASAYQLAKKLRNIRASSTEQHFSDATTSVTTLKSDIISMIYRSGITPIAIHDMVTAMTYASGRRLSEGFTAHGNHYRLHVKRRQHTSHFGAMVEGANNSSGYSGFINQDFMLDMKIDGVMFDNGHNCGIIYMSGSDTQKRNRHWIGSFSMTDGPETVRWDRWEEIPMKFRGTGKVIRVSQRHDTGTIMVVLATRDHGTYEIVYFVKKGEDIERVTDRLTRCYNKEVEVAGTFYKDDETGYTKYRAASILWKIT